MRIRNCASSPFKEGGYYLIKYPDTVFLIYTALQNKNRSFHSYASIRVLDFLALYIIIYTQRPSNQVKNMQDNKNNGSLFHIFSAYKALEFNGNLRLFRNRF